MGRLLHISEVFKGASKMLLERGINPKPIQRTKLELAADTLGPFMLNGVVIPNYIRAFVGGLFEHEGRIKIHNLRIVDRVSKPCNCPMCRVGMDV